MSDEHQQPTPTELIATKDRLLEAWHNLPAEHQATLLLTLVEEVMRGDMAMWMVGALSLLYFQDVTHDQNIVPAVTRAHLKVLDLSPRELTLLTEADLIEVSRRMRASYEQDGFWDELAFHVEEILTEKDGTGTQTH